MNLGSIASNIFYLTNGQYKCDSLLWNSSNEDFFFGQPNRRCSAN